ncbi:MAG: polysaccharide lyase family 7 protein [Pseudomonadota bacterium]|nr:polysaccharide lyase family 7 protein [Pseudomonadota bacterium]
MGACGEEEVPTDDTGCPASLEVCDGVDNDCNGLVDDFPEDGGVWYADVDGDGHGDASSPILACEAPAGAVAGSDDCEDADPAIHPGAGEICNGLDDDCDGALDDDDPDQVEPCFGGEGPQFPSDVLNLTNWKLTLPVGDAESPTEIEQPELESYSIDPYFLLSPTGDGVVFRANAGGVSTSGSGYPRSELREMTNDGADKASWSTSSGTHTLTITQAITHLPEVKPHVVAGQIHDANDDVVVIRLEADRLFVDQGGTNIGDLDTSYQLGEEFTVRFVAENGEIGVYYEDMATPAVTLRADTDGCYFKAGTYTQSNTDRGDAPEAYGEVEIYDLVVSHR